MYKNVIVKLVMENIQLPKSEETLMEAMEEAVIDMESARIFFENVEDPNLIDYAIYMEEAAKARYSYLLTEAKKLNVKTKYRYLQNNMEVV